MVAVARVASHHGDEFLQVNLAVAILVCLTYELHNVPVGHHLTHGQNGGSQLIDSDGSIAVLVDDLEDLFVELLGVAGVLHVQLSPTCTR